MRCNLRFRVVIILAAVLGFIPLFAFLKDKYEVYDPLAYISASITTFQQGDNHQPLPLGQITGDKIIVTSRLEKDDMSWVVNELPDWQHAIYTVNPSGQQSPDSLVTPMNKGHEAMAYLTYIIENYNKTIPSVVAFIHSHEGGFLRAWHVDTPLHDNAYSLRHLQLDYVQEQGYVNLRCNINPGCKPQRKKNGHISGLVWQNIMGNSSTPLFNNSTDGPAALAGALTEDNREEFATTKLEIQAACCAQFAVSKEQIYTRPWQDYYNIRQWLFDTDLNDAKSGRVLEYLWHIIFGKEAIHCPNPDLCYCRVYGRCGSTATRE